VFLKMKHFGLSHAKRSRERKCCKIAHVNRKVVSFLISRHKKKKGEERESKEK